MIDKRRLQVQSISVASQKTKKYKKVTINCMTSSLQATGPPQGGPCFNRDFWEGAEQRQGGLTCLEWDFGSGGLKKESGSFLILMGTEE